EDVAGALRRIARGGGGGDVVEAVGLLGERAGGASRGLPVGIGEGLADERDGPHLRVGVAGPGGGGSVGADGAAAEAARLNGDRLVDILGVHRWAGEGAIRFGGGEGDD